APLHRPLMERGAEGGVRRREAVYPRQPTGKLRNVPAVVPVIVLKEVSYGHASRRDISLREVRRGGSRHEGMSLSSRSRQALLQVLRAGDETDPAIHQVGMCQFR